LNRLVTRGLGPIGST